MKESKYYQKHHKKEYNKTWLTKLLLSIIFFLLSLIFTNISPTFKSIYQNNILNDTFAFYKINELYNKYFTKENNSTILVANNNDFSSLPKEEVNGSYKIKVNYNYPITVLSSGIIVYIGDKEDLNNTVIIQGNDGIDIWYSNINITDYNLYDYLKKDTILGTSLTNEFTITIMKDGEKLSLEQYPI